MKLDTLNALIRAFNSASDDPTRFHLNGVLMFSEGNMVHLVAANGHLLTEQIVEDEDFAKALGYRYLVSPEALPMLKILAKDYKTVQLIPHEPNGSRIVLKGFGCQVEIKTEKEQGCEFPDYKQLAPKPVDEPMVVGINAEYLYDIFKTLQQDKRQKNVKLVINGPLAPITITCGDPANGSALLMPVRL